MGLEKTRYLMWRSWKQCFKPKNTKILQLSKSYYENLYKSTHPNIEEVKTYIDNTKINKKLRMEESLIC